MRYVSQILQPLLTIPKNAKIKNTEITCKSQKLLLECGLVRPTSSGLFTLLPLACRALDKLEALCKSFIEEAGAQQVSFPALTRATLWQKSGRLQDAAAELMQVKDRQGKTFLLAPTYEEAFADLLADIGPLSYKQLPLVLYQISCKYRDEARPKRGLLRARAFRMLDAYGAHASRACAHAAYARVGGACRALFRALRLPVHAVEAPAGDMGGTLSHEWQLCAGAGEDAIHVCSSCSHATLARQGQGQGAGQGACEKCGGRTERFNSIEVGHTFMLGRQYSEPLRAHFVPAQGPPEPLHMCCYGIGITRLLAAGLEALSTDAALRWPRAVAPYSAIVIGPKEGSAEWRAGGWERARRLGGRLGGRLAAGGGLSDDVLVDDRHHLTIGKRLMMADRMGYPTIVVCGKASCEDPPRYEVHAAGAPARLCVEDELLDIVAPDVRRQVDCNTD